MANGTSLQDFNSEQYINRRKRDWILPYVAWFSKSKYQYSMTAKQFRNKLLNNENFREEVKREKNDT